MIFFSNDGFKHINNINPKLKICIIGPVYPYRGGLASFNQRLAQEFIALGHHVDIVTFTLQYPSFLFPGKSQMSDDPAPDDLNIRRGVNSINPFTWWSEGRKIKKKGYDLILTRFWLPVIGVSLAATINFARNTNTKVISIIDNMIPHEKRIGDAALTNYFVKKIDGFIVMSHKVGSQVRQFSKTKPYIYNPHPIYDNYGEIISRTDALDYLQLDPQFDYVLFFGFIRKYKGLDLLIKAFAQAAKSNDKLRLIVAGEFYADSDTYLSLIEELNLSSKVILHTQFITNEEVKYYFCAADLVAQTYYTASQSGISQLAINFEKPILSTNVGGLPETTIHKETGYLVNVDEAEISDAMRQFFESEKRPDFSNGIKKLKETFSWSTFTTKLFDLDYNLRNT